MSGKSGRQSARKKPPVANTLAQFLADPRRPPETLRYHELQGFLFAVASAPDLVRPSEWMPEVFGGQEAGFEDLDEAQAILPELMAVYNAVNGSVASERAALPADCRFRRNVLANLDVAAPVSMWARGFVHGHQWLEEDCVPRFTRDRSRDREAPARSRSSAMAREDRPAVRSAGAASARRSSGASRTRGSTSP